MRGNRWKFFLLGLTFIGWAILASFTFGIGMLLVNALHNDCFHFVSMKNLMVKQLEQKLKILKLTL